MPNTKGARILFAIALAALCVASANAQGLIISPNPVYMYAPGSSTTPVQQNISITSAQSNVPWSASYFYGEPQPATSWLSLVTSSGFTPNAVLTVRANPTGLVNGTYVGFVRVQAPSVAFDTNIQVNFVVGESANIIASPSSLSFSATVGQAAPATQTINLSTNVQALSFSATATMTTPVGGTWLTVVPTAGSLTSAGATQVTVFVDHAGLSAGSYSGKVRLAAPGATNSPIDVAVTLTVAAGTPGLTATPSTLTFTAQAGGSNPATQNLVVGSTTGPAINFTATVTSGTWLTVNGGSSTTGTTGASSGTVVVGANLGTLAANVYTGQITLTSTSPASTVTVTVTLNLGTTGLTVSPSTMQFTSLSGEIPATQSLFVSSTSGSAISFTVSAQVFSGFTNWLQVSTSYGTTPTYVTVSVAPFGLSTGNYTGRITLTPTFGTAVTTDVTLSVGGATAISVSPSTVTLYAALGGNPTPSLVTVSSTSVGVSFSVLTTSSPIYWLNVTPIYATTPASLSVSANSSTLSAGTYYGQITIQSYQGNRTVQVTLIVGSGGTGGLTVSPGTLTFSAPYGGSTPAPQSLFVQTSFSTAYTATASVSSGGTNWLIVTPTFGTAPTVLSVSANPAGLINGTYYGSITINTGTGTQAVQVSFAVGSGGGATDITVNPTALTFSAAAGGSSPGVQSISVFSNSGLAVPFNASATTLSGGTWLSVSPTSGTATSAVNVQVNPAFVVAGTYTGTIFISTATGTQSVTVTFNATGGGGGGVLSAAPSSLAFATPVGVTPAAQSVTISGATGVSISVSASSSGGGLNWLSASPASGVTPATLVVSVSSATLPAGLYTGTVAVTSSAGSLNIPVTLNVGGASGTLIVSPLSLSFSGTANGPVQGPQYISVSSATAGVAFIVSIAQGNTWLSVNPAVGTTGATPNQLVVYVNPSALLAGTYQGTINVTGGGGSQTVQVTFVVGGTSGGGGTSQLTFTPGSLTFSAPLAGSSPAAQSLYISSSSSITFTAAIVTSVGSGWLSVSPASSSAPAYVTVTVNSVGLPSGIYTATIYFQTIYGTGTVPVTLNVGGTGSSTLVAYPTSLSFTAPLGVTPASQSMTVSSATTSAASFLATSTVSWLSLSPAGGVTPTVISVTANPAGLAAGNYTGSITLTPMDGTAGQSVQVQFVVGSGQAGGLTISPSSLSFTGSAGGASPAAQTLTLTSNLGYAIQYTATASTNSGGSWLFVSPVSGYAPQAVTVSVNTIGLAAGTYSGQIMIAAAGYAAQTVQVTLTLTGQYTISVSPSTLAVTAQTSDTTSVTRTVRVTSTSSTGVGFSVSASGGAWLSASPASGTTPADVTVTINPTAQAAGTYNGTVTITAASATNSPQTVSVTLTVSSGPSVTSVVNGASMAAGALSPGAIFTVFGRALSGDTPVSLQIGGDGLVTTTLNQTRVLVDGIPAPMIYAQARQINAVIPYGVAGRASARVEVEYRSVKSPAVDVQLVEAAPGIFSVDSSGQGQGAILNQNLTLNTAANAADPDSVVAIYATGGGQTDPAGEDGSVPGRVLPKPLLPVSVLIGNSDAPVTYAGAAPGLISGVLQVNVRIPRGLQRGSYPITLRLGRYNSQLGVTVAVGQ